MRKDTFMEVAKIIARESKCVSLKVGAIIVKDDRIISTGYNGTPAGQLNCNEVIGDSVTREDHHEWSKRNEIHAELNAILYAAKNGIKIDEATIYCTHSPCPDCSKAIAQSGIKKVVYNELYHRSVDDWDDILHKSNIEVINLGEVNEI